VSGISPAASKIIQQSASFDTGHGPLRIDIVREPSVDSEGGSYEDVTGVVTFTPADSYYRTDGQNGGDLIAGLFGRTVTNPDTQSWQLWSSGAGNNLTIPISATPLTVEQQEEGPTIVTGQFKTTLNGNAGSEFTEILDQVQAAIVSPRGDWLSNMGANYSEGVGANPITDNGPAAKP